MQTLTLEQLRTAVQAGGIVSVTLQAEGDAFILAVATRSGGDGVLVTSRAKEPRRFADLRKAMLLLHAMGIATVLVDATRWNPDERRRGRARPDRAVAMKQAHEAAAHDWWFRAQVEEGLREAAAPGAEMIPHEEVMAEMKALISRVAAKKKRRGRAG